MKVGSGFRATQHGTGWRVRSFVTWHEKPARQFLGSFPQVGASPPKEVTRYCMALSGDLPTLNADVAGDATATATAALDGDHAAAAAVDGDASTYWSPPPA